MTHASLCLWSLLQIHSPLSWASHIGNPEFAVHNSYLIDPANLLPSMPPLFYPAPFCGLVPVPAHDELLQHGGLYAAPIFPYAGPVTFVPLGGLVPLCYNAPLGAAALSQQPAPTIINPAPNTAAIERAIIPEAQEIGAQEGLRQRHAVAAPVAQAQGAQPQGQVVRRFRVGFQLDLLLILKLAVVVFFFNQDGFKDRLLLLLFLAAVVYMYQTGALTPILRWISTNAQRFIMPPPQVIHHPPNGQAQQEGVEHGGGNMVANERNAGAVAPANGMRNEHINAAPAGDGAVVPGAAIPAPVDQHPVQGPRWWDFLKEIQILVVGFVTSLFPGFQNPE
ncbi:hypothetical protein O6H91_12G071700 [Diphasiastrum complanatum]|uniref:Uncharacterized protein n=1 Tax=Diphasiastrum complanatum TaxID=34168 RepID=A0ACC2C3A5_DIPCM|nr:hypothetical protein O6H91_12G071700 [Diphasiastrum complanatum]